MNFLGIDYGRKRVGLSGGDDELKLAVPLGAIRVGTLEKVGEQIAEIVKFRRIHKIIVGYPINMDDSVGAMTEEVDHFIDLLRKDLSIPVERMDERLTSENVGDVRRRSGKNRQNLRRSGAIDSAAAVLILQDYFDVLG
ncbi:MAG: Holliday junction resolvase RuvX [Puniceicoccales bacterium]|jgi:putative Holliday junction resolvase|nr:Holliday junction resolvase RuvX [Puniceicoccales bacterium]